MLLIQIYTRALIYTYVHYVLGQVLEVVRVTQLSMFPTISKIIVFYIQLAHQLGSIHTKRGIDINQHKRKILWVSLFPHNPSCQSYKTNMKFNFLNGLYIDPICKKQSKQSEQHVYTCNGLCFLLRNVALIIHRYSLVLFSLSVVLKLYFMQYSIFFNYVCVTFFKKNRKAKSSHMDRSQDGSKWFRVLLILYAVVVTVIFTYNLEKCCGMITKFNEDGILNQ